MENLAARISSEGNMHILKYDIYTPLITMKNRKEDKVKQEQTVRILHIECLLKSKGITYVT